MTTKAEKLKAKLLKDIQLPSKEELYENPVKTITVTPTWFDSETPVMEFITQYLTGFLWECKYGKSFVAMHTEQRDVEHLLHHLEFLQAKQKNDEWWPTHDEEFQLALFEFARLVPMMWD